MSRSAQSCAPSVIEQRKELCPEVGEVRADARRSMTAGKLEELFPGTIVQPCRNGPERDPSMDFASGQVSPVLHWPSCG